MSNFFKSRFFAGIIIITVIIFAVMAASTVSREKALHISDAVGVLTAPVSGLFSAAGNATHGFFSYFSGLSSYREKYFGAEKEKEELERKIRNLEELENENERLRALLAMKERQKGFETVGAEVVGKDPGNWFNTFVINKGLNDGLAKNMGVISEKGLIGHIYEIGSTWAKVITLIDPKYGVGATVVRTNDNALVEGDLALSREGLCKMSYIAKGANVVVGDYVETSGLGGIYPKGLLIGKISQVTADSQGLYQIAAIEPGVDFERISEVLVIKKVFGGANESNFE